MPDGPQDIPPAAMLSHAEHCERLSQLMATADAKDAMLRIATRWRQRAQKPDVAPSVQQGAFNQYAAGLGGGSLLKVGVAALQRQLREIDDAFANLKDNNA